MGSGPGVLLAGHPPAPGDTLWESRQAGVKSTPCAPSLGRQQTPCVPETQRCQALQPHWLMHWPSPRQCLKTPTQACQPRTASSQGLQKIHGSLEPDTWAWAWAVPVVPGEP